MLPLREILLRLTVAAVLGAIIGAEREWRRRPAGVRTSFFVCLATALFTILSGEIAHQFGDTSGTRIASNIVQGVGFLGAGAILRESGGLVGMTTAATIFVEAAIGMAAGGGLYTVAVYAAGLVLFGLVAVAWFAEKINLKRNVIVFRVTTSHEENVANEVHQLLAEMKIPLRHFRNSIAGTSSTVEFEAEVSYRQRDQIVAQLNRQGVITEIVPSGGHWE